MSVVDSSFDHPLKLEEEASAPFAGGVMQYGYQCGMIWGAALAAGAEAYRRHGPGPQAETEAIMAAQRIVESFRARTNNEINCREITHVNFQGNNQLRPILKFFVKGGPIGCFRMAAGYAPKAFDAINSAFSVEHSEAHPIPLSCATVLAQKMGMSDMHTVMAAGFAGGVGFSGGACGALGAAIWIIGMNGSKEGVSSQVINSRIEDAIDRFLNSAADFEFECSEIVGRRFESIGDHAAYLQDGGCAEIIEALAANDLQDKLS